MHYLIIGNGVAGTTAAASIRKTDREGLITIITDEPYPFYSRVRLIDFLAGETDEQGLIIRGSDWHDANAIRLLTATQVTDLDPEKKEVATASGAILTYDRLLLATGASSFVPPLPGADRQGVFTLRNLADARRMREFAASSGSRAVLLGGGVLGLETGNSLRKLGKEITVIEVFPRLLPRQLDSGGAAMLRARLETWGFRFFLGATVKEIQGRDAAETVMLADGTRIASDMIIVSAGIRNGTALAAKAGLRTGRGLLVNDRMETSHPDIFGAGDVVEHNGMCYGIWPAAEKQGAVAGTNMAGGNLLYRGTVPSNTLKIAGIDLVAVGDIDGEDRKKCIRYADSGRFVYKKMVIERNRIVGAILFGDVRDRVKITKAIESGKDIRPIMNDIRRWNLAPL